MMKTGICKDRKDPHDVVFLAMEKKGAFVDFVERSIENGTAYVAPLCC